MAQEKITVAVVEQRSDQYKVIDNIMEYAESELVNCFYLKLGENFCDENVLFVYMGTQSDESLQESYFSIKGDGKELYFWKRKINIFKKKLLKGAYVVNPLTGVKAFYKNSYYTSGGLQAFQKGVKIMPISGWNYYILAQNELTSI